MPFDSRSLYTVPAMIAVVVVAAAVVWRRRRRTASSAAAARGEAREGAVVVVVVAASVTAVDSWERRMAAARASRIANAVAVRVIVVAFWVDLPRADDDSQQYTRRMAEDVCIRSEKYHLRFYSNSPTSVDGEIVCLLFLVRTLLSLYPMCHEEDAHST
jgi:hypothetical protein